MGSHIINNSDGTFTVTYDYGPHVGGGEFATMDEATAYLITVEEQYMPDYDNDQNKEPAASDTTPEMAVEINSDVRVPSGATEQAPNEARDDVGSGNHTAPHVTDSKGSDDKGKAN